MLPSRRMASWLLASPTVKVGGMAELSSHHLSPLGNGALVFVTHHDCRRWRLTNVSLAHPSAAHPPEQILTTMMIPDMLLLCCDAQAFSWHSCYMSAGTECLNKCADGDQCGWSDSLCTCDPGCPDNYICKVKAAHACSARVLRRASAQW